MHQISTLVAFSVLLVAVPSAKLASVRQQQVPSDASDLINVNAALSVARSPLEPVTLPPSHFTNQQQTPSSRLTQTVQTNHDVVEKAAANEQLISNSPATDKPQEQVLPVETSQQPNQHQQQQQQHENQHHDLQQHNDQHQKQLDDSTMPPATIVDDIRGPEVDTQAPIFPFEANEPVKQQEASIKQLDQPATGSQGSQTPLPTTISPAPIITVEQTTTTTSPVDEKKPEVEVNSTTTNSTQPPSVASVSLEKNEKENNKNEANLEKAREDESTPIVSTSTTLALPETTKTTSLPTTSLPTTLNTIHTEQTSQIEFTSTQSSLSISSKEPSSASSNEHSKPLDLVTSSPVTDSIKVVNETPSPALPSVQPAVTEAESHSETPAATTTTTLAPEQPSSTQAPLAPTNEQQVSQTAAPTVELSTLSTTTTTTASIVDDAPSKDEHSDDNRKQTSLAPQTTTLAPSSSTVDQQQVTQQQKPLVAEVDKNKDEDKDKDKDKEQKKQRDCNFLPTYNSDEVQRVFREETTFKNGTIRGKFTYINFDNRYRLVHYTRLPYGPVKIDFVEELGKPLEPTQPNDSLPPNEPSQDADNSALQIRRVLPNSLFGFPFVSGSTSNLMFVPFTGSNYNNKPTFIASSDVSALSTLSSGRSADVPSDEPSAPSYYYATGLTDTLGGVAASASDLNLASEQQQPQQPTVRHLNDLESSQSNPVHAYPALLPNTSPIYYVRKNAPFFAFTGSLPSSSTSSFARHLAARRMRDGSSSLMSPATYASTMQHSAGPGDFLYQNAPAYVMRHGELVAIPARLKVKSSKSLASSVDSSSSSQFANRSARLQLQQQDLSLASKGSTSGFRSSKSQSDANDNLNDDMITPSKHFKSEPIVYHVLPQSSYITTNGVRFRSNPLVVQQN